MRWLRSMAPPTPRRCTASKRSAAWHSASSSRFISLPTQAASVGTACCSSKASSALESLHALRVTSGSCESARQVKARSASPALMARANCPMPLCGPNRQLCRSVAIFRPSVGPSAELLYALRPAHRSLNTAPDSTEASWSGSPSSISRALSGIASSNAAINLRSTIDASSTTTTSTSSGFCASWVGPAAGRKPSKRCSVAASALSKTAPSLSSGSAFTNASRRFAAALPVAAVSATRGGSDGYICANSASALMAVLVLPVPGPPLMMLSGRRTAMSVASRCSCAAGCSRTPCVGANRSSAALLAISLACSRPISASARRFSCAQQRYRYIRPWSSSTSGR